MVAVNEETLSLPCDAPLARDRQCCPEQRFEDGSPGGTGEKSRLDVCWRHDDA